MIRNALIVAVVLIGLYAANNWLTETTETQPKREELKQSLPPTTQKLRDATLEPWRVVELDTSKGKIEFVLFRKDAPVTSNRIARLVSEGDFDGVKFERVVPDKLIQTDFAKERVPGVECEVKQGLINTKGSVGMAHPKLEYDQNQSSFYILIEPQPNLNYQYTVFGRVTRGMNVAMKIAKGDIIKKASVRSINDADRVIYNRILEVESRRRTQ